MRHADVLQCLQVYRPCVFKLRLDFVSGGELRVEVSLFRVEPNCLSIGGNRLRVHLMREIERAEFLLSVCAVCFVGYQFFPFCHCLFSFAEFDVERAEFSAEAGIPRILFQRVAVEF